MLETSVTRRDFLAKSGGLLGAVGLAGLAELAFPSSEASAALLRSIPFFSQLNPAWKSIKLGTCNDTIGSAGCAMTAATMLVKFRGGDVNPEKLNKFLKNNNGYSQGCLLVWAKVCAYPGTTLKWVNTGSIGTRIADLKKRIDQGQLLIAKSSRFSSHWGVIKGYANDGTKWDHYRYLDPADKAATERKVGDGWIGSGSALRIYK